MKPAILTVNGGSSSLKCALFTITNDISLQPQYHFHLSNILGEAQGRVTYLATEDECDLFPDFSRIVESDRHEAALQTILNWLNNQSEQFQLRAIGHRVVHGGSQFNQPVQLTPAIREQLSSLIPLAPLHQPYNLKLVDACSRLAPELPQIACFDTMFHASMPTLEYDYALPRNYRDAGIRRYGFHGLSYEYIQRRLADLGSGNLNTVICHLGAGASMCAVRLGKSVASSMGFTAVEGLPMGSRCGNLDPGVLLYLQRHYHMSTDALENLLYKQSGWLGVSGISSDMLTLHQAQHPDAEKAIDMFCYRAALEIGRLSAALQGLEQLVFTGGVGENDADVRQRILQRCQWLGAELDSAANTAGEALISRPDSSLPVRVIATNEEAMIAQHVLEQLNHAEH